MREFLAITKAISDESRVRILMILQEGELCVCQIVEMLGLAPSTISKHMTILVQAGLVAFRKEGKWHYYRLPDNDAPGMVLAALAWIRDGLAHSPIVVEDRKHLKAMKKMDIKTLCNHYKKWSACDE